MNKRETIITIFSCECCGRDFEKENECKEHEKRCLLKFEDKDIQSAVTKIRQVCKNQDCENCRYYIDDEGECFFDGRPDTWCP